MNILSLKKLKALFSTIRHRALLIALLPLFVCASALTVVTVYLRTADSELNLQNFAETTIDNLASSAGLGIYSGNIDLLRSTTETPLKNAYVAGISFYDNEGKLIFIAGKAPALENIKQNKNRLIEKNGFIYHLRPIKVLDDDLLEQGRKKVEREIGQIALTITTEPLMALRHEILLTSLLAFSGIFSLSFLLSNAIGRSISRPIYQISDAVAKMEAGELQKRAPVTGTRETRLLANTLNRLAERVEDTNQELQLRIASATNKLQQALEDLELRNRDLEDIRVDLENALAAKDAFLARMSHELRTPLTSVIGFNRLLDSAALSAQQRQYTRNIEQASALLLSTIEDILDFSKLESGAMTLEAIEFDLPQLLEDLIALQAFSVYDKDLELVLLIDSDVPAHIEGDPVRIKQILNNLLSNAIKFTESGEIILRVSQTDYFNNSSSLAFMVKDSGIGIARENLRNLFQPFQQADNTISRRFGGTGLGLSICQQLIEQMGGIISIDSTPGLGTEVSFTLDVPVIAKVSPEDKLHTFQTHLPTLIIDSMPWSRRALRNVLSLWLNDIYAVADVDHAISLLDQQKRFALMVLSLRNSQLNEHASHLALLNLRKHYTGPILLLAGSVDFESNLLQQIQQQFSPLYLLTKPSSRLQLHQAIASINALTPANSRPAIEIAQNSHDALLAELNVLIIEDNSFNRQLLQTIITRAGGEAITASDGMEGIKIFDSAHFDLVIVDMHMPVLNGIETTAQLRAHSKDRTLGIIGLTADLNQRNLELMIEAGADAVLGKPIDEPQLLAMLCEKSGRQISNKSFSQLASSGVLSNTTPQSKIALAKELNQLTECLLEELSEANLSACKETAHQITGLAGLFGMYDIQTIAREMNEQIKANDMAAAQTLTVKLLTHTRQLNKTLETDNVLLQTTGIDEEKLNLANR